MTMKMEKMMRRFIGGAVTAGALVWLAVPDITYSQVVASIETGNRGNPITQVQGGEESPQGSTSKKEESYLPQSNDIGIGVDATPFLFWVGNFFGKTNPNIPPSWSYPNNFFYISGRYFLNEKTAIRAGLRIGFGSETVENYVSNDATPDDPFDRVKDSRKHSYNAIGITGGLEFRRGTTRVQGYYGAEFGIAIVGEKFTYTYGNSFEDSKGKPTSTIDWNSIPPKVGKVNERVLERQPGTTLELGLRGFVGVEIFIFPKVSIGGEFGWGLGLSSTGEGTSKKEYWDIGKPNDPKDDTVKTQEEKTGKKSFFAIDTDDSNFFLGPRGMLRINFYF